MPRTLSNQRSSARLPTLTRPCRPGLFSKPATARSTLVLPLPEGPTSASSSPRTQLNSASSRIGPSFLSKTCSMGNKDGRSALSFLQRPGLVGGKDKGQRGQRTQHQHDG